MKITIRTVDSLGCAVAGSAVIHSLRKKFSCADIVVVTPFVSLFYGIPGIVIIHSDEYPHRKFHVDLRNYTKRRPHSSVPRRPSYVHMHQMAIEQIGEELPLTRPKLYLSSEELFRAKRELSKFPKDIVWIQTRTNSNNRHWGPNNWSRLSSDLGHQYQFLDLSKSNYSLRESLAIAKVSRAGICLDSFLVHGSAAVGAKNVLVLLGSSHPTCVTYPEQTVMYVKTSCPAQPCGMHGYTTGCSPKDEKRFFTALDGCIFDTPVCMNALKYDDVKSSLFRMLDGGQFLEPKEHILVAEETVNSLNPTN